jgi:hypothetical protein
LRMNAPTFPSVPEVSHGSSENVNQMCVRFCTGNVALQALQARLSHAETVGCTLSVDWLDESRDEEREHIIEHLNVGIDRRT